MRFGHVDGRWCYLAAFGVVENPDLEFFQICGQNQRGSEYSPANNDGMFTVSGASFGQFGNLDQVRQHDIFFELKIQKNKCIVGKIYGGIIAI